MALAAQSRDPWALVRQMLAFGTVGVAGFAIDAGTLTGMRLLGLGLILGRVISYLTAATCTWALNRRYTFTSKAGRGAFREWLTFLVSQLFGAAFNLGLYGWLVTSSPMVATHPVIGVAAGSLAGMLVNFFVARKFVFKDTSA
jgi:putative flippase GtrA